MTVTVSSNTPSLSFSPTLILHNKLGAIAPPIVGINFIVKQLASVPVETISNIKIKEK
jgi:hypothetical protein